MISSSRPDDERENTALASTRADFSTLEGLLLYLEHAAWRHSKGFYSSPDLRAAAAAVGAAVLVHRVIRERDGGAASEDEAFELIPARARSLVRGLGQ